ncbi:hypothetical protein LJR039_001595 [Pseudorhodoferax sp. LjRoot39]|uniref:hypothetical protein n=1 Tax=Pseudorhodoferax sp. LjRoot39 TaxID=3342328 RepID=UPI003ECF6BE4
MSSIRPLPDHLVVQRSEPETRTASGIVVPGSVGEQPGLPHNEPAAATGGGAPGGPGGAGF